VIIAFKVQAQASSLNLQVNNGQVTLHFAPTITNGDFFILNSNKPQSLISSGTMFYSEYVSNAVQGFITTNINDFGPINFFTMLEYPDATPADLVPVPPINDDDEDDVANSYFFDVSILPYPLVTNMPINLTINVDDSQGNLQPVNGEITFWIVDSNGQNAPFDYSIVPPQFLITNGIGSGRISIQTTNDLSQYFLAVTFSQNTPISVIFPNGQAFNANPLPTPTTITTETIPLGDYQDQNGNKFMYPLPDIYPIIGGFGEWPGHGIPPHLHWGVDLGAPAGTTVVAAKKGIVTKIGYVQGPNKQYVVIDHGDGYATTYMHIKPSVTNFQVVDIGKPIGTVGHTSYTTLPEHLHFEIMQAGFGSTATQYKRGVRYPYPLINPINQSGAFVFTPTLWDGDDNHVAVEAAMITEDCPATQTYNLKAQRTFQEQNITNAYFLVQIADLEVGGLHPITPLTINFMADENDPETVDYENSTNVISTYLKNPSTPGYAALTPYESSGNNLLNYRYKYWFNWDTSSYAGNPIGPRSAQLICTDITGTSITNVFSYGPQILAVVPDLSISGKYYFTNVAYLGSSNVLGNTLTQPDEYKCNVLLPDGSALSGVMWSDMNGNTTAPVYTHLQTNSYTFTLPWGTAVTGLRLLMSSALMPDIADIEPFPSGGISFYSMGGTYAMSTPWTCPCCAELYTCCEPLCPSEVTYPTSIMTNQGTVSLIYDVITNIDHLGTAIGDPDTNNYTPVGLNESYPAVEYPELTLVASNMFPYSNLNNHNIVFADVTPDGVNNSGYELNLANYPINTNVGSTCDLWVKFRPTGHGIGTTVLGESPKDNTISANYSIVFPKNVSLVTPLDGGSFNPLTKTASGTIVADGMEPESHNSYILTNLNTLIPVGIPTSLTLPPGVIMSDHRFIQWNTNWCANIVRGDPTGLFFPYGAYIGDFFFRQYVTYPYMVFSNAPPTYPFRLTQRWRITWGN
jgi:murein DD-endopeptidase MepM/ murein hydrolase activator NlpD